MAVTTTAQQVLDAAYNRSSKNRVGIIMTDATEGLQLVIRSIRGLFAYAARANPFYFAESAAIGFAAGGWARPEAAESIFRIETGAGVNVVVVPFDDRQAEPGEPGVYEFGGIFRGAGNLLDPVAGNLVFFYARRPLSPGNVGATIDAQWPEQFNELLFLEVAVYMAIKDGRMAEAQTLMGERDTWAKLFVAFLEHATAIERRRFGNVRRFNTNTLVPLRSLLAGGPAPA